MSSQQKEVEQMLDRIRSRHAEGWSVRDTTKGWMILAPNGVDKITVHKTNSDSRSRRNLLGRLRRAGWTE